MQAGYKLGFFPMPNMSRGLLNTGNFRCKLRCDCLEMHAAFGVPRICRPVFLLDG